MPASHVGHSNETAGVKPEEGGDDVKSSWPLCPGLHTCYNADDKPMRDRKVEQIGEKSAQFGLRAATRPHEVGIGSNRRSAGCGEYVLAPCTHFNITRLAVNLSTWCKSMLVVKKIMAVLDE